MHLQIVDLVPAARVAHIGLYRDPVTEMPRPPRSGPKHWPIVVSGSSATRDLSSMTPMNTNSGTATRTSLLTTPKKRPGMAFKKIRSKAPTAAPARAKRTETTAGNQ
jgi:uracil phosphoribosyltransferase